jgi:hypothetical protein
VTTVRYLAREAASADPAAARSAAHPGLWRCGVVALFPPPDGHRRRQSVDLPFNVLGIGYDTSEHEMKTYQSCFAELNVYVRLNHVLNANVLFLYIHISMLARNGAKTFDTYIRPVLLPMGSLSKLGRINDFSNNLQALPTTLKDSPLVPQPQQSVVEVAVQKL